MDELLGLNNPAPLSLVSLTINMLIGIVLSVITAWYYVNYGKSLSNRSKFAQVLPILTMITILIISVVKSSLALSLGLVGALSIVRFRTAIKEPEELIYLFMAIAIGLGLGADQRWPTVVAITIILGYLVVRHLMSPRPHKNNLYFNIATADQDGSFSQINEVLLTHVEAADLHRLDHTPTGLHATYLIHCPDDGVLATLMDSLRDRFPQGDFSFVEQDNTLGG